MCVSFKRHWVPSRLRSCSSLDHYECCRTNLYDCRSQCWESLLWIWYDTMQYNRIVRSSGPSLIKTRPPPHRALRDLFVCRRVDVTFNGWQARGEHRTYKKWQICSWPLWNPNMALRPFDHLDYPLLSGTSLDQFEQPACVKVLRKENYTHHEVFPHLIRHYRICMFLRWYKNIFLTRPHIPPRHTEDIMDDLHWCRSAGRTAPSLPHHGRFDRPFRSHLWICFTWFQAIKGALKQLRAIDGDFSPPMRSFWGQQLH